MSHVPGKRNQIWCCITPMISPVVQRFKVSWAGYSLYFM